MTNYLAIDFGEKNIGLAYKIGQNPIIPTTSIIRQTDQLAGDQIKQFIQEKEIDQVIVGWPLTLRGEVGPQAKRVKKFIGQLKKKIKIPVMISDERMTSLIFPPGLPNLDSYAAGEILSAYLNRNKL